MRESQLQSCEDLERSLVEMLPKAEQVHKKTRFNLPFNLEEEKKVIVDLMKEVANCFNLMVYDETEKHIPDWTLRVKERDKTCQICGSEQIQAHHILHRSKYPKLALILNNGISLCIKCHQEVHLFEDRIYRLLGGQKPQRVNVHWSCTFKARLKDLGMVKS